MVDPYSLQTGSAMSRALELVKRLHVAKTGRCVMDTRIIECDVGSIRETYLLTMETAFWSALDEFAATLGMSFGEVVATAAQAARREDMSVEDMLRNTLIRYFRTKTDVDDHTVFARVTPPRSAPRVPRRSARLSRRA